MLHRIDERKQEIAFDCGIDRIFGFELNLLVQESHDSVNVDGEILLFEILLNRFNIGFQIGGRIAELWPTHTEKASESSTGFPPPLFFDGDFASKFTRRDHQQPAWMDQ